jgi:hypothetical protein
MDFRIEIKWNPDDHRFEMDGTMEDEMVCLAMLEKAKFSIMRHHAEKKGLLAVPNGKPSIPDLDGKVTPFRR